MTEPTTSIKPTEAKTLRQKGKILEKEIVGRTLGYIVGAFGLVAALAWNDVVQEAFASAFPSEQTSLLAKLVYAMVSTILALLVIVGFSRWAKK